jgi:hypothetical protein
MLLPIRLQLHFSRQVIFSSQTKNVMYRDVEASLRRTQKLHISSIAPHTQIQKSRVIDKKLLDTSWRRNFFSMDSFLCSPKSMCDRRLLYFSPEQVFNIVAQVDKYQEFLPWCKESKIVSVSSNGIQMKALLKIGFQAFTEEYLSLVTLTPPSKIEVIHFSK